MFPGELFSGGVIFLGFAFDQGVSKNRPKEAQLPSFQALKTASLKEVFPFHFFSTSFFTDLSVCVYCAKDQVTGFCFFFTLNLFLLHHPTLSQRLVLFLLEHLEH